MNMIRHHFKNSDSITKPCHEISHSCKQWQIILGKIAKADINHCSVYFAYTGFGQKSSKEETEHHYAIKIYDGI